MSTDVFLSYSRRDLSMMEKIRDKLREGGISVWTDENLEPGTDNWKEAIEEALEGAKSIVVLLSPSSKKSEWVRRELEYSSTFGLQIFPVLVTGSTRESIPFILAGAQYADVSRNFDKGWQQLQEAVHKFCGVPLPAKPEPPKPQAPKPDKSQSPPSTALSVEAPAFTLEGQQLQMVPAPALLLRLRQWLPVIAIVIFSVVFQLLNPNFLSARNISNILFQSTIFGFASIGLTLLANSGAIDLSVGAAVALAGGILATMLGTSSFGVGAIVAIIVCVLISLLQAYINIRFRLRSVIDLGASSPLATLLVSVTVSLIAQYIARALNYLVLGNQITVTIQDTPYFLQSALSANNGIGGILPVSFIAFAVFAGIVQIFVSRRKLEERLGIIRNNIREAERKQIPVRSILYSVALFSGFTIGVSAILITVRLRSAYIGNGTLWEAYTLAAILAGGTSLLMNVGGPWRTVLGSVVIATFLAGLVFVNIGNAVQQIMIILFLVILLALDFAAQPRLKLVSSTAVTGSVE